jgi:hypothetical protein
VRQNVSVYINLADFFAAPISKHLVSMPALAAGDVNVPSMLSVLSVIQINMLARRSSDLSSAIAAIPKHPTKQKLLLYNLQLPDCFLIVQ